MEVIYSEKAQKDREFWKKTGNKAIINKISALIEDIILHPYEGIGKPEALKHHLTGFGPEESIKNTELYIKLPKKTLLKY